MTTITIPKALLEQALEALEYHTQQTRPIQKTEHAILALRTELAKPDRPIKDSWHFERLDRLLSLCLSEPAYSDYLDSLKRVAGFSAELAKPVERAEPAAWRTFDGEGGYMFRAYEDNEDYQEWWEKRNPHHKGWVEPLYLHPPTPAWCDAPEVAALKAERDELLAALQGVAQMSQCGQLDQFIGEPWLNSVFAAIAKAEEKNHERP